MTDTSQYTGSHKERYNFDTFVAFQTRPVLPSNLNNERVCFQYTQTSRSE